MTRSPRPSAPTCPEPSTSGPTGRWRWKSRWRRSKRWSSPAGSRTRSKDRPRPDSRYHGPVTGRRWGLVGFALVVAAAVPARGQTEPGGPEISVDGAPVPAAPAPAYPAAPPSPASPADAALERVLRSGCRDGLAQVRALRGDPSAPWADTVERLCGNVLRTPAPAGAARGDSISESASA